MKVTRNDSYRRDLLNSMRVKMGIGTRRSGIHVSDLIMCVRKAWAEKATGYVAQPTDYTVIAWLRGLSHEELAADGIQQVRSGFCFQCQVNRLDAQSVSTGICPVCGDTLLTGTIDWMDIDMKQQGGTPVEMKSTMKSARKDLSKGEMAWFVDQVKSYMAMHDVPLGHVVINHVMGSYKKMNSNIRSAGPEAELFAYDVQWEDDQERARWLKALEARKKVYEGPDLPPLDAMSPAHSFICDYCEIGEKLPNGQQCELFPWVKRADGVWVRKGSKEEKAAVTVEDMKAALEALE